MNESTASSGAAVALVLAAALALCAVPASAQTSTDKYAGRSLAEALRLLQSHGLRIVFTSTVVTPELRVDVEPRAPTARRRLDELLAPHGLEARDGPGEVIQVVRATSAARERPRQSPAVASGTIEGLVVHADTRLPLAGVVVQVDGVTVDSLTDRAGRFLVRRVPPGTRMVRAAATGFAVVVRVLEVKGGTTVTVEMSLSPAATTHTEYVEVSEPRLPRHDPGVSSETSLDRREWERLHGGLADQPMRVVHALPRVSAVDDFQVDFAVRGSPFRHVEVVVDGVSTDWLRHTVYGRGATGSIGMLTGQVLEDATLRAGAYPHRYGDRLGAQLDLTLREGSRDRFRLRGAVGGINATLVGEGPLGRSARGSWLVAGRQSLLEWPDERAQSTRTPFGFSDWLAKAVYDVHPGQQAVLSVLGGTSNIDAEDHPSPTELGDGTNRASVVNFAWRSTFESAVVLKQRIYLVRHSYVNKTQSGQQWHRGGNDEIVYRADVARPIPHGLLEAGAQAGWAASRLDAGPGDPPASSRIPAASSNVGFDGSSWTRSSYAHFAWAATPAITLSPGVRVTKSSLVRNPTVTRWILGQWAFAPGWALDASAGLTYQMPNLRYLNRGAPSLEPRPERARHLDIAIERRLAESVRWQATVFTRNESDVLRDPEVHPRLVDAVEVPTLDESCCANALQGSSRGIELMVERRSSTGLSGWAAYSFGKTRYTDASRAETFWADFDQRHALNLFGVYRFSDRTSVGATWRAGTNFPIPGYLEARNGGLFVGHRRNQVRLPAYSRLDVRADRTLESFGGRVTLSVEVLNVMNRVNVGIANGSVRPSTGEAVGFTDTLLPRSLSAGALVRF